MRLYLPMGGIIASVSIEIMGKYTNRCGIAERYHLSLGSVKNLMRKRILPFVKIGRLVRFDTEKCDKALAAFESSSIVLEERTRLTVMQ
jgi:hypothetical protein